MSRALGDRMVEDERFKLLTFTGSPSVGWRMKERAGKKRVVLELGGNAGVIVDQSADLDWAVRRCLVGAFSYAGQVCISVQRIFIHSVHLRPVHRATSSRAPGRSSPAIHWTRRPSSDRWSTNRSRPGQRRGSEKRRASVAKCSSAVVPTVRSFLPRSLSTRRAKHRCAATRPSPRSWSRFPSTTSATRSRQVNDSLYGLQTGVFTNDLGHAWRVVQ